MRQVCAIVVLAVPFSVLGCNSSTGEGDTAMAVSAESAPQSAAPIRNEDGEVVLAPAQIPQIVRNAALAAVPGFLIELAELEGNGIYCVHGTAAGVFTEVEVDADGHVIEIEQGDDDDDGGDDGDDDDDDDGDDDGEDDD